MPGNSNPLGIEIEDEGIKRIPKKTRVDPIVKPNPELLKIESENTKFEQLQHEDYFHDFFGFKDKGKRQINPQQDVLGKFNRGFNIVSNNPIDDLPRI